MTGLEFAAVALIGVLVGRLLPNRRKGPKDVKPICGCGHHHSYHDPATSKCNHGSMQHVGWEKNGNSKYEKWTCVCRQYSGPVPMPEFFAPEMTA
jgi:hypothetical protein